MAFAPLLASQLSGGGAPGLPGAGGGGGPQVSSSSSATSGVSGPTAVTSGVTIGAYNPGTAASKNLLYVGIGLSVVALAFLYFKYRKK